MADRQHEVTRIEGFSDAVFGFALTLLVISLGAPTNQAELELIVRSSVLIFGLFLLRSRHAWSKRAVLELSLEGQTTPRYKSRAHMISAGLGVVSIALTLIVSEPLMWIPGMLYILMGPLHGVNGYMAGKAQSRLQGSL